MQLLRWGQVEIIDYVRYICDPILTVLTHFSRLRRIWIDLHVVLVLMLPLESVLDKLPLLISITLACALEPFMGLSLLRTLFVILIIHHLVLVSDVDHLLFLHLDVFRG